MEIWKDINGYEGDYQISNLGRVKTLKKQVGRKETEKIMTPVTTYQGYSRIVLRKNGKGKIFAVHRLVAEAFIPKVEGKPIVDHINGDRKDNRVENLRWCTFSENAQNTRKVLSDRYNSVKVIDSNGNIFDSYRQAGRQYGISANTVKNDCLGKTEEYQNFKRKIRFRRYEKWILSNTE